MNRPQQAMPSSSPRCHSPVLRNFFGEVVASPALAGLRRGRSRLPAAIETPTGERGVGRVDARDIKALAVRSSPRLASHLIQEWRRKIGLGIGPFVGHGRRAACGVSIAFLSLPAVSSTRKGSEDPHAVAVPGAPSRPKRTHTRRTCTLAVVSGVLVTLLHAAPALAAPPPNDAFAAAQPLSGTSATISGTTVEATLEAGEPGTSDRRQRQRLVLVDRAREPDRHLWDLHEHAGANEGAGISRFFGDVARRGGTSSGLVRSLRRRQRDSGEA